MYKCMCTGDVCVTMPFSSGFDIWLLALTFLRVSSQLCVSFLVPTVVAVWDLTQSTSKSVRNTQVHTTTHSHTCMHGQTWTHMCIHTYPWGFDSTGPLLTPLIKETADPFNRSYTHTHTSTRTHTQARKSKWIHICSPHSSTVSSSGSHLKLRLYRLLN